MNNIMRYIDSFLGLLFGVLLSYLKSPSWALFVGIGVIAGWIVFDSKFSKKESEK